MSIYWGSDIAFVHVILTFFFLTAERKKITKKKDCRLHFLSYSSRVFR